MSELFKKALGLFVEFDDAKTSEQSSNNPAPQPQSFTPSPPVYKGPLSQQDIDKFSKHFNDLFDKSNIQGPDYYEFSKMMHMLEASVPDENVRISAVYATLSIQGLTKDRIIDTAKQYCSVLENDKAMFEKAAADKSSADVEGRKNKVTSLEKKIADNSEMIRKLTQEITDAQTQIGTLKNEIVQEDAKISANKGSYGVAYQAMLNKITSDIQKINTVLK